MMIDSDLPPVPQAPLDELLLECLEALVFPSTDGDKRETHIQLLEDSLGGLTLSDDLRTMVEEVASIFRGWRNVKPILHVHSDNGRAKWLASELAKVLGQASSRYVFHGTIWGRLAGICKEGLIPGRSVAWKESVVSREHCDSAVFFTTSWRMARGWAAAAHQFSRGRRDGKHRTPAIIRLPSRGLSLEPDPLSAFPGSVMVRGAVQSPDLQVIWGEMEGFPLWRPLAEVLATK